MKLLGLCAAAATVVLSACILGPDFGSPEAPSVIQYTNTTDPLSTTAKGEGQQFKYGDPLGADWWRLFKSPQLDAVMKEAIAHNPSLEAAEASLHESEDNLRSGYGIFFPAIDANANATRQKSTPVKSGLNSPPSIFNLFTLTATISYSLDIFGGNRRLIEGLGAQVDMARATEEATWLTLEANIANTVIASAAYHDEIKATQELIDMQKEQVKLAEDQEQAGAATYASVLSLRSELASFEVTLPQLEQKLTQSEDLLANLSGHMPSEWHAPVLDLSDFTLPADLPVSLPSNLIHQRPDILIAEDAAHAASADIGVATAAMFPNFTLNGSYGNNSFATNTLFTSNSNFWSAGVAATMPIFDAGTLWFKREAAKDNYQQAMALYRQSVLGAFEQVADTLRALEHDAEGQRAEDEALSSAEQALHLSQANYQAGLVTYLEVLSADVQYHQAKIGEIQTRAARYQDTTALFAALGGGWWNKSADTQEDEPINQN